MKDTNLLEQKTEESRGITIAINNRVGKRHGGSHSANITGNESLRNENVTWTKAIADHDRSRNARDPPRLQSN